MTDAITLLREAVAAVGAVAAATRPTDGLGPGRRRELLAEIDRADAGGVASPAGRR